MPIQVRLVNLSPNNPVAKTVVSNTPPALLTGKTMNPAKYSNAFKIKCVCRMLDNPRKIPNVTSSGVSQRRRLIKRINDGIPAIVNAENKNTGRKWGWLTNLKASWKIRLHPQSKKNTIKTVGMTQGAGATGSVGAFFMGAGSVEDSGANSTADTAGCFGFF